MGTRRRRFCAACATPSSCRRRGARRACRPSWIASSLKALAPDLKDRYASCEELRHDLAKFLAQTSPTTDTRAPGELPRRAVRRRHRRGAHGARDADREGARVVRDESRRPAAHRRTASRPPRRQRGRRRCRRRNRRPGSGRPAVAAEPSGDDQARDRKLTVREPSLGFRDPSKANREVTPALSESNPSLTDRRTAAARRPCWGPSSVAATTCASCAARAGWAASTRPSTSRSAGACALKILHPAYSQTPDLVERLRREARAASKISHPNVVDVTDSGTTPDGAFFFVMEYLEGDRARRAHLPREAAGYPRARCIIGTQICRALQAAHEAERHPPRSQARERPDPERATGSRTS